MGRLVAITAVLLLATVARGETAVDWAKAEPVSVLMLDNRFVPDHLTLQHDRPYLLQVENLGSNEHQFTASSFLGAAVLRDPALSANEVIVVPPGGAIDLYLVPIRAGSLPLRCAEHELDGMVGEIVVE